MKSTVISEMLMELIGNVNPIQETNHDNEAYENQEKLFDVMDACLDKIVENAQRTDDYAYSVKRIKDSAIAYLGFLLDYCFEILDDPDDSNGEIELENCATCGGKAHYTTGDGVGIECEECGVHFEPTFKTKAKAATAWNKRMRYIAHLMKLLEKEQGCPR